MPPMAPYAQGTINLNKLEYFGKSSPSDHRVLSGTQPLNGSLSAHFEYAQRNNGGDDSPGGYSHLFGNNTPTGSPPTHPGLFGANT